MIKQRGGKTNPGILESGIPMQWGEIILKKNVEIRLCRTL